MTTEIKLTVCYLYTPTVTSRFNGTQPRAIPSRGVASSEIEILTGNLH